MKNILTIALMAVTISVFGQAPVDPPYKRFPTIPEFKLLLVDSSTVYTRDKLDSKKSTILMLFSPDCDHCKHETEALIKNIDSFKNVQIIMATPLDFTKMKEFYKHYDLKRFKNIHVGKEYNFYLPTYYGIKSFPFMAFYNKKRALISGFEGSLAIEKVIEETKK